jgi:hypothetical protein
MVSKEAELNGLHGYLQILKVISEVHAIWQRNCTADDMVNVVMPFIH